MSYTLTTSLDIDRERARAQEGVQKLRASSAWSCRGQFSSTRVRQLKTNTHTHTHTLIIFLWLNLASLENSQIEGYQSSCSQSVKSKAINTSAKEGREEEEEEEGWRQV